MVASKFSNTWKFSFSSFDYPKKEEGFDIKENVKTTSYKQIIRRVTLLFTLDFQTGWRLTWEAASAGVKLMWKYSVKISIGMLEHHQVIQIGIYVKQLQSF